MTNSPSDHSHTPSSARRNAAIHLVVDDRECRGPMLSAICASGAFTVAVQRLPVGDYCLDGALLFERKTLPDLAASIADGRLFKQSLRLVNAKLPAALILEGAGWGNRKTRIRGSARKRRTPPRNDDGFC